MSGASGSSELSDDIFRLRFSERFGATDSDLTLQSSDGVLYKVHRKNLEFHSEGFAAADAISAASGSSEVVELSESSAVLNLLLQYMYRQRQPDLGGIDFETLAELAEAAEKYEVYSAMTVCSLHMKYAITIHAAEVLCYAFKHDYPEIMDAAAPLTIGISTNHLVACWAPISDIWPVWVQYNQAWLDVLDFAHMYNSNHTLHGSSQCSYQGVWDAMRTNVSLNLRAKPEALRDLQQVFGSAQKRLETTCRNCFTEFTDWRNMVQQRVVGLPKFSALL